MAAQFVAEEADPTACEHTIWQGWLLLVCIYRELVAVFSSGSTWPA